MKQLSGAPITMHKKGLSTDTLVLETILHTPGMTIAEIAKELKWTNGKVDGSINRLLTENKISLKHCLKRGMIIKKIYPRVYNKKSTSLIEIPKEIINLKVWMKQAFIYALSRSTIGVAPQKTAEWETKAFCEETVSIRKDSEKVALELPERLAQFYQLDNSEISLSAVGDLIFVTVESVLPTAVEDN